ncbi:DUF5996 family protein [Spirosoma spitsbergense]|uniref:DUF5996 family protein n=1 Tax=Spirosoma spitsbergense TaxID=431554 RepID=UPI003CCC2497
MGEFLLPYDVVRKAVNPEQVLLSFLNTTDAVVAQTGHWSRTELECDLTSFETRAGRL